MDVSRDLKYNYWRKKHTLYLVLTYVCVLTRFCDSFERESLNDGFSLKRSKRQENHDV